MKKMVCEWYDRDSKAHIDYMSILLNKRKMTELLVMDLPSRGIICSSGDIPIAAAFIRMIEGRFGLFDSFITNPDIDSSIRNEVLNRITDDLIFFTKHELDISNIFCFSSEDSIMRRALNCGFKYESDMRLFSMSLHGGVGLWVS